MSSNLPDPSKVTSAEATLFVMPWLRLLRLPTVFTSISNVVCGYLITADTRSLTEIARQSELWLLISCSSFLYLSGMVLNDAFDAGLDAVERPERPIPSGAMSRTAAFGLGFVLMAMGLVLGAVSASPSSLWVSVAIACSVLLYDSLLKNTKAAAVGMATCRMLNLLLGCVAAVPLDQLFTFDNPAFPVALGLAVYVFGVTVFAMNEAGAMSVRGLWAGTMIAALGVGIHFVTAVRMYQATRSSAATGCLIILSLLLVNVLLRAVTAIRAKQSIRLQKTVGFLLFNIIFFDAAMTFCLTGSSALAACILLLVAPATLLKKVLPLS